MVDRAAKTAVFMNRRDTEPYVRWCGRTGKVLILPSYPIVPWILPPIPRVQAR
jgi:hypothetical protein